MLLERIILLFAFNAVKFFHLLEMDLLLLLYIFLSLTLIGIISSLSIILFILEIDNIFLFKVT